MSVADRSPLPVVDVLMLCRPNSQPADEIIAAIQGQRGVRVHLHQGTGWRHRDDTNRWQTIARGRNRLKSCGSSPWAMFVDDDVFLGPDCVRSLLEALTQSPSLGAIAADSEGEQLHPGWAGHVGMAACMFRRDILERLEFRSTADRCECWCCCEDLRRDGWGITYCDRATATHLKREYIAAGGCERDVLGRERHNQLDKAVVLAAFDRRDVDRFERQFLHSLRAWGNQQRVIAVAYGLYPSELERVRRLRDVEVIAKPADGEMAPVRRLRDFADVTRRLSGEVPVAYWDVADVVFQTSLSPLWGEVARRPDKLLAVVEPKSYPHNGIIPAWALSIHHPAHRHRAFELLKCNGFLNSGFAAGTASTLHAYFDAAWRMRYGPELFGTSDWGDQMCLNLYCHSDPSRWQPIHEGWNYCVHDRPSGEVRVTPDGQVWSRRIGRIPVVHGNARSLRQFAILVH